MEIHLSRIIKLSNFNNPELCARSHEDHVTDSLEERGLDFNLRIETLINYRNNGCVGFRICMQLNKYELLDVHLLVSVIDISGNKQHLRTFNEPITLETQLHRRLVFIEIEDYASLETLRNKSSELLTDDCLTIQYDVFCTFIITKAIESRRNYNEQIEGLVSSSFEINSDPNGETCKLYLHSEMATCLRAKSMVFQNMYDFTPSDDDEKYLPFPRNEAKVFAKIYIILNGGNVKDLSLTDFCDVYNLADFLDIPVAINACRDYIGFLSNIAHEQLISMHIYELQEKLTSVAQEIDDDRLWKCIEESQKVNSETYTVMREQYRHIKREMDILKELSPFNFSRWTDESANHEFYNS